MCKYNLKQIGLAFWNYESQHHGFPPSVSGEEPMSWRVRILPFIDQDERFRQYDERSQWDRPPNAQLATTSMLAYACPSNLNRRDAQGRRFTDYSMPTGPRTIGENPDGTRLSDIIDGSNNTIVVVEASGTQLIWPEPRDVGVNQMPTGINLSGPKSGQSAGWLSSYHKGGVHILLVDGSVRFISQNLDPATLIKLVTIDGGETVGTF